jgi:hypothetical protein
MGNRKTLCETENVMPRIYHHACVYCDEGPNLKHVFSLTHFFQLLEISFSLKKKIIHMMDYPRPPTLYLTKSNAENLKE